MKKYRNISLILFILLLLTLGFSLKQYNDLKKVENALFNVAISSTMSDFNTHSLEESLNEMTQKKLLYIYEDGSSVLERDLQKLFYTYGELYRYYIAMYGTDNQVGNYLQEVLQDFHIFFNSLGSSYKNEAFKKNNEDAFYLIVLKDEAYEGSEIITAIIRDLENIRSEVYEYKAVDDEDAWKTLIIKYEEYAQSNKVQQDLQRIQKFIKMWDK